MAVNRGRQKSPAGLVQVHPVDEDAGVDVDIIAIHGLDTRSPDTWTWKDPDNRKTQVNWLEASEMLPSIVGRARIFTCDWPADLFQDSDLTPWTVEEFARRLLAGIQIMRRPSDSQIRDRPILFIASCLGGIILMKALVMADNPRSDYLGLRRATRGILFLATPFRGTAFQDIAAWAEPMLKAWASLRNRSVTQLLDTVKGSTFDLEELVRRFTQLCQDKVHPCEVFNFYETEKTTFKRKLGVSWPQAAKLLVDRSSACLDIVLEPLPLKRPHGTMNRFRGCEDPDYNLVAGRIRAILQKIRERTPLKQADAWIRDEHYTADKLKIERLSRDKLPMDQCYINLAIVEQSGQDASRSKTGDTKSSPFSLFARQKVETPDKTIQVELGTIFNQREGRGGRVIQPRRILIRGRAGVGKTTLCKKIVHEFTQGTWVEWSKLFDRILWVPLRNLKLEERRRETGYDFACLFRDEYFTLPNKRLDLAEALSRALETKTLFLLDGLDEVSQDLTDDSSMSRFLKKLLEQPNVIVTSRPSAQPPPGLDLELETIGFYPDQVKAYIERAFTNLDTGKVDSEKTDEVQSFLQGRWLIQGLVRIPIQLDALCYTWGDLIQGTVPDTMTGMYKAIEQKLWRKDVIRLEKKHDGELVTSSQIETVGVEDLVLDEIYFLEGLAFTGLHNDVINFTSGHRSAISQHFKSEKLLLGKMLPRLSFLRTSDPSPKVEDREYHFIHLTFQEYFAAQYFVRQWNAGNSLECLDLNRRRIDRIEPASFVRKHKYAARYNILWRFVAGLLDADGQAGPFIDMIETEPLDLLGPTHQRLAMHCLSEVSSDIPMRTDIEQRLSKWLLFECRVKPTVHLAREVEFPERVLENVFSDGSEYIKTTILESLTKRAVIPQSIIYQVTSWLEHQDDAVECLCRLSPLPEEILQAVAGRLEHENGVIRKAAIQVLGRQPSLPGEILKAVAARLEDEAEYIRRTAIEALGRQSALPREILKAVARRLKDKNKEVCKDAIKILYNHSYLPREILEAVAGCLGDKNIKVRQAAVEALGSQSSLPGEILDAVAGRLEDEDESVRRATIQALHNQSALPGETYEAVAGRLEDKDESIRRAGIETLYSRWALSKETLKAVTAQLKDKDKSIRRAAFKALYSRWALPGEILETVAEQLKDKDKFIHEAAIKVLRSQSALPKEILKVIARQLEDKDRDIRWVAIEVLRGRLILPEEILKVVAGRLEDEDKELQQAAVSILCQQSALPRDILKVAARRLEDMDENLRGNAISILRNRSDRSALPREILEAVAERLEDEHVYISTAAFEVLSYESLPGEIIEAMAKRMKNEEWYVRYAAVLVLHGESLPREILEAVAGRLEDEDGKVRRAAVNVLYDQQSALPWEILEVVAERLEDENWSIRDGAEAILRRDGEFYRTLLNGTYVPSLYDTLLPQAFEEQLCWYIHDGNSYINTPEHISTPSTYDEQNHVRAMINEARPKGFPPIGREGSSCAADITH